MCTKFGAERPRKTNISFSQGRPLAMAAVLVAIFWEKFDYGGVGTYLITLLNNKRFKNFQITIFTNTTNKAINKSFRKEVHQQYHIGRLLD